MPRLPKKMNDFQFRHAVESGLSENQKMLSRNDKVKGRVKARKAEIIDFLQNWDSKTAAEKWEFTKRALTVLLQDLVDEV